MTFAELEKQTELLETIEKTPDQGLDLRHLKYLILQRLVSVSTTDGKLSCKLTRLGSLTLSTGRALAYR
jgi:hypothetical protein